MTTEIDRARVVLAGLDERARSYARRLAQRGGIGWGRAPRLFADFAAAGLVERGRDSESLADTAFATPLCKVVAAESRRKEVRGK